MSGANDVLRVEHVHREDDITGRDPGPDQMRHVDACLGERPAIGGPDDAPAHDQRSHPSLAPASTAIRVGYGQAADVRRGDPLARQRVGAGGRDQTLRDPAIDVVEALEPAALLLDPGAERVAIELHVGEVLEQDVDGFYRLALELLAG